MRAATPAETSCSAGVARWDGVESALGGRLTTPRSATAEPEPERRDRRVVVDHAAVGADDDVAHAPAALELERDGESPEVPLVEADGDAGDAEVDLVLQLLAVAARTVPEHLPVLGEGVELVAEVVPTARRAPAPPR